MLSLDNIKQAVAPLAEKYDILKVELFGSYADGKATEASDADFLVFFRADIPSIFKVMGFKEELENSLRYPVDVVTPITKMELNIDNVINIYERAR